MHHSIQSITRNYTEKLRLGITMKWRDNWLTSLFRNLLNGRACRNKSTCPINQLPCQNIKRYIHRQKLRITNSMVLWIHRCTSCQNLAYVSLSNLTYFCKDCAMQEKCKPPYNSCMCWKQKLMGWNASASSLNCDYSHNFWKLWERCTRRAV